MADRARAAVRDAATRDGSALGSTFGYLPEPQRELAAPAPPAGTIEIVTRASALDYSDSWSDFKLTPERLTKIFIAHIPAHRVVGRPREICRLATLQRER